MINIKSQFNAKGDGITDDSLAIQSALDSGQSLYFPAGIYIVSSTLKIEDLRTDMVLCGDGILTTIKRRNGVLYKDFQHMISVKSSKSVNIAIKDICFDGNARLNPLPSGSHPTDFEHTHCLFLLPEGYRGINDVRIKNVSVIDCTADGISLGGNDDYDSVNSVFASNLREERRTRTRSGLTLTCGYDSLLVSNCSLEKLEVETNSPNQMSEGQTAISNCVLGQGLDFNWKNNKSKIPTLLISNSIINGKFNVIGYDLMANNCQINLSLPNRLNSGNSGNKCDINYNGCSFKELDIFEGQSLITVNDPKTSPRIVKFLNCQFESEKAKYVFNDNNAVYPERVTIFDNCSFLGKCENVLNFRSGIWRILRNYFKIQAVGTLIRHTSPNILGFPNYVEIGENMIVNFKELYIEPKGNWTIVKRIQNNFYQDGKKVPDLFGS